MVECLCAKRGDVDFQQPNLNHGTKQWKVCCIFRQRQNRQPVVIKGQVVWFAVRQKECDIRSPDRQNIRQLSLLWRKRVQPAVLQNILQDLFAVSSMEQRKVIQVIYSFKQQRFFWRRQQGFFRRNEQRLVWRRGKEITSLSD